MWRVVGGSWQGGPTVAVVSSWQHQWRLRAVSGYQDTGQRQSPASSGTLGRWSRSVTLLTTTFSPGTHRSTDNTAPGTKSSWSHPILLDLSQPCGEIGLVWSVSTIVDMSCQILPCPLHLLCLRTLRFSPGLAHCHLHSGSSYVLHILYSHGNVVLSSLQLRSRVTAACIVHQQRNVFKLFLLYTLFCKCGGSFHFEHHILISLNNFGCEWWWFSPLIWTMSYCNIPHISSLSSPVFFKLLTRTKNKKELEISTGSQGDQCILKLETRM